MFDSRRARLVLALALVFLFWVSNRAAYKGYFSGDDLDNLAWNQFVGIETYVTGFLSPFFDKDNFRPTGHLYFFLLGRLAGLNYLVYVAVIQIVHICNAWILWMVLRRLRLPEIAAWGAVVVFLFHPATFGGYWLPMYIFDLLCGTFSLLTLLFWIDRRWITSFVTFWLAYKAKELGVMLPAVLLAYEFTIGERKWKPLIPFFAVSASFGLQALFANRTRSTDYTLSMSGVWNLAAFYASRMLANWWILVAFLAAGLAWLRDRRILFAVVAAILPAIPLLVLPRRVFDVYLYVSVCFVAIGVAALFAARPRILVPLGLLIWIPLTYLAMRSYRADTLRWSAENRLWMRTVQSFLKNSPDTRAFVFDGYPDHFNRWGVSGGLTVLTRDPKTKIVPVEDASAKSLLSEPYVCALVWDDSERKLHVTSRDPATADASFVRMDVGMPVWQFGEGWYLRDGRYRWTKPVATANLYRPPTANQFELQVNAGQRQITDLKQFRIKVYLDDKLLGESTYSSPGWHTSRWPIESGPQKLVQIRFMIEPEYRTPIDPRLLGAAIGAFGFR